MVSAPICLQCPSQARRGGGAAFELEVRRLHPRAPASHELTACVRTLLLISGRSKVRCRGLIWRTIKSTCLRVRAGDGQDGSLISVAQLRQLYCSPESLKSFARPPRAWRQILSVRFPGNFVSDCDRDQARVTCNACKGAAGADRCPVGPQSSRISLLESLQPRGAPTHRILPTPQIRDEIVAARQLPVFLVSDRRAFLLIHSAVPCSTRPVLHLFIGT